MAILKDKRSKEAIIREVVKSGDTVLVVPAPTEIEQRYLKTWLK